MKLQNCICSADWIDTGDYIWTSLWDRNGIVKIDKKRKTGKVIATIDDFPVTAGGLYSAVIRYYEKLVFIPSTADDIAVMDLQTEEIDYICLDYSLTFDKSVCKFWQAFIDEGKLYLVGQYYPAIICVDLVTHRVTEQKEWVEQIRKSKHYRGTNCYINSGSITWKNKMYFPVGAIPGVIEIDKCSMDIRFVEIYPPGLDYGYLGISRYNGGAVLTIDSDDADRIILWEPESRRIQEVMIEPKGKFFQPIIYNTEAFLFPVNGDCAVICDLETGVCRKKTITDDISHDVESTGIVALKQDGDRVVFQMREGEQWYEYDLNTDCIISVEYSIDDEPYVRKWIAAKMGAYGKELYEHGEYGSLKDYLCMISEKKQTKSLKKNIVPETENAKIIASEGDCIEVQDGGKICVSGTFVISHARQSECRRSSLIYVEDGAEIITKGDFKFYYGADVCVLKGAKLFLGSGSYINSYCDIRCSDRIEIGDGCAIAQHFTAIDSDFHEIDGKHESMPVIIEDHVWIGMRVTVLKGVRIGEGSVIAAGAVVTRDIPPGCLAAGVPARVIRKDVVWK